MRSEVPARTAPAGQAGFVQVPTELPAWGGVRALQPPVQNSSARESRPQASPRSPGAWTGVELRELLVHVPFLLGLPARTLTPHAPWVRPSQKGRL